MSKNHIDLTRALTGTRIITFILAALYASSAPRADPIPNLPLPEKRPGPNLNQAEIPEHWSEAEITEARKKCVPILIAANADFKMLDPIRNGACGTPAPVKLSALGSVVRVKISPPTSLNCNMVRALDQWLSDKVQPVAQEIFGSQVIEIRNVASYSCRRRYNDPRKKLSEHALANAMDIAGLKLANGKYISLIEHWGETERHRQKLIDAAQAEAVLLQMAALEAAKKTENPAKTEAADQKHPADIRSTSIAAKSEEASPTHPSALANELPPAAPLDDQAQFLRQLHAGACGIFGTVLGPEANEAHANHFHFDLAPRRRSAYCE